MGTSKLGAGKHIAVNGKTKTNPPTTDHNKSRAAAGRHRCNTALVAADTAEPTAIATITLRPAKYTHESAVAVDSALETQSGLIKCMRDWNATHGALG